MRFNSLWRVVNGAALALVVMLGITTAANAQYRDNGRRWSEQRMQDYALKLGYHTGYSEAERERSDFGRRGDHRNMPAYRDGMNGWLAHMGDREDYRRSFRRGYEMGWSEFVAGRDRRYDREHVEEVLGRDLESDPYYRNYPNNRDARYGRNDRNEIYRIAQQNGYNEGLEAGRNDRARRRAFDYDDRAEYRNANRGYRSEYGDRNVYRQGFQDGYRRGYEEGYRNRTSNTRWPF